MNTGRHFGILIGGLVLTCILVSFWVSSAAHRLEADSASAEGDQAAQPVASASDESYCTKDLKQILRRVLTSCGLVKGNQGRGCQPLEAKKVAAMSGTDFNALFKPLSNRAAIIQFDQDKAELDDAARNLLEQAFADQRGASYFLVVSRASPEGASEYNTQLSEKRAGAVLGHLKDKFQDPDLEQEVGLLWLGAEFAQLDDTFCQWKRSRQEEACTTVELNRSAFIAWIDCRL